MYSIFKKEKVIIMCSDTNLVSNLLNSDFRLMMSTDDYQKAHSYYIMLKGLSENEKH